VLVILDTDDRGDRYAELFDHKLLLAAMDTVEQAP
jgi:hypothetical protein